MIELPNSLKNLVVSKSKYDLSFAQTEEELTQLQRLRFEVFNQELNAGKTSSVSLQKDQDEYDQFSHHMMIKDRNTGEIVSTIRVQEYKSASENIGFYTSEIFDTSELPAAIMQKSVEMGRFCTKQEHRSIKTFYLIKAGLDRYLEATKNNHFIGCFSLITQNSDEAYSFLDKLKQEGYIHSDFSAKAMPQYECPPRISWCNTSPPSETSKLLKFYYALGTRIASPPALDTEFKTIDFLIVNSNYAPK